MVRTFGIAAAVAATLIESPRSEDFDYIDYGAMKNVTQAQAERIHFVGRGKLSNRAIHRMKRDARNQARRDRVAAARIKSR